MILLDTDILTLALAGHPGVAQRSLTAPETPAISIISRIEVLQGRFDSVIKAAKAEELLRAQERLAAAEQALARLTIIPFDAGAATEFERVRQNKKLKRIGRKD